MEFPKKNDWIFFGILEFWNTERLVLGGGGGGGGGLAYIYMCVCVCVCDIGVLQGNLMATKEDDPNYGESDGKNMEDRKMNWRMGGGYRVWDSGYGGLGVRIYPKGPRTQISGVWTQIFSPKWQLAPTGRLFESLDLQGLQGLGFKALNPKPYGDSGVSVKTSVCI